MKKFSLIIQLLILCMTMNLTACDTNNLLESGLDGSEEFSETNKLTEGIYITYDRSKYENITVPKCYYAEYQTIEQQTFLELFSSEPLYNEEIRMYYTDTERGLYSEGNLLRKDGYAHVYSMLYFTKAGDDYDTAVCESYENYLTTKELEFMMRNKLRADFLDKTKGIFSTDLEISAYAIDKESYLKEVENYNSKTPNEIEWSAATDYYYIKAYQTVDGIPISENMSGDYEKGTSATGCEITAVYTEKGLEYLDIYSPWRVVKEAPIESEFIDLSGAEKIIKIKNENLLISNRHTIESVRLVYLPIVKLEGTILTPVWEFCDYMGTNYPLYTINAYTGEIL